MSRILWEAWELFITLIESSISMHFVCTALDEDTHVKQGKQHWLIMTLLLTTTTTLLNHLLNGYEGMLMCIYFSVVFLASLLMLNGKLLQKAFLASLFLAIILMDSTLISNLISGIMEVPLNEIYTLPGWIRLVTMALVQLLNFYFFQILEHIFRQNKVHLRKIEWTLLLSVFIFSIGSIVMIQLVILHAVLSEKERYCLLCVDVALLAINIFTILLITLLSKQNKMNRENMQLKLQMQYQERYADTVKQQEESVHRLRHDIRATISTLYEYIEMGNLSAMKSYLQNYSVAIEKSASIVHTNQPYVNAILNTKLSYAKEQNILCTCHCPQTLPNIESRDICSLLGNLLDNAITYECSGKVEEPEILVDIEVLENGMHICIKNRIAASMLKDNTELKTTKKEKQLHGYGKREITDIVSKHNGVVAFTEKSGWFIANATVYE